MTSLVYASRANNIDERKISDILEKARANNAKLDVSGVLLFNSAYFLQCLEGSRESVNELYQKILNDDRHSAPLILDYRSISERDYSQWSMGYIGESVRFENEVLRFSNSRRFQPYQMAGDGARAFLKAVASSCA
ncbi:MAG: BLUF domain-containing protein [Roseibium sp.]|nr:BLUF domain-containing protein [Roseibium sp.]